MLGNGDFNHLTINLKLDQHGYLGKYFWYPGSAIWENIFSILVVLLRERERERDSGFTKGVSDITAVSDVKNYVTLSMRDVVYFKT